MRCVRLIALLGACQSLAACTGLLHSTQPAVQLYMLSPPATPASLPVPASSGPTLRIDRPLTAPGLNTDRIALLRPAGRLDYYAGGRWSGGASDVVGDLLVSAFHADAAWRAVTDDRSGFNADYVLQTTLGHFAAEYTTEAGAPLVRVQLQCLLIRRADDALLGSFAVEASQPAEANRMASVVAAFSGAADQVATAAVTQADQLLRSAKSPASP